MKILNSLLVATILFSCTQKSDSKLSEEQKKRIQEEIQPVIVKLYDAAAHADTAKLYDLFSFEDDFTYIEITGEFYNEAAYKQMAGQWFNTITSEVIEKGAEKYNYINEDNVIWSYSGALTATYKDGRKEKYNPFGMTLIFKKINNQWKAVFIQESTQQSAAEDTTKHS
jgi:ketosteroid isomerase-like protein